MKTKGFYLVFAAIIVFLGSALSTHSATPAFTTLQPGQFREIDQNLPVNIVFVGYHQGSGPRDINETIFRAGLPHRYRTLDVDPSSYIPSNNENDQVWVGNSFDYNYNIVYANQAFEDAYFNYLPSISVPCFVTVYQQYYNTQHSRSLDVTNNICVEATLAEAWLAHNAPAMLGVDTAKDTVFLINWYGRPDFRFHTYLPFGYPDPDPDTGFVWANRQSREMISWGGTTPDDEQNGLGSLSRIWFHDLSAGPESNTTNFLLDGDDPGWGGQYVYTIPPVWEYGNMSAYRPFDNLSGDLAKITRYSAIDCLFTKSPILPPALSPPKLPNSIQFDVNLYQADPTWDLRNYITPARITSEHAKLRPYNTQSTTLTNLPFDTRQAQVYQCGLSQQIHLYLDPSIPAQHCYGNRGDANDLELSDFFLYHQDHENQFLEGDADLEVPIFDYGVPDSLANPAFLGLTDDDHRNGTRASFIYCFTSNSDRQNFGQTNVITHEAGHFLGAAHPHDGWDYEDFTYYSPRFQLDHYYMWGGDNSDSVMSYLNLSGNFSQFDRDNMNRWMSAVYINQANKILTSILASPRANQVTALLSSADSDAGSSLAFYGSMNYLTSTISAKSAYDKVLTAAAQINVHVEPEAFSADYKRHSTPKSLIDPPKNVRLLNPIPESEGQRPFR